MRHDPNTFINSRAARRCSTGAFMWAAMLAACVAPEKDLGTGGTEPVAGSAGQAGEPGIGGALAGRAQGGIAGHLEGAAGAGGDDSPPGGRAVEPADAGGETGQAGSGAQGGSQLPAAPLFTVPPPLGIRSPGNGYKPAFVATGHGKRISVSCDDGQTWFDARAGDAAAGDLAHNPGVPQGLAYGNGAFVAVFGWGAAGALLRTDDGRAWAPKKSNGNGFAGLTYNGAGFLAIDNTSPIKSTDGNTWSPARGPGGGSHYRRLDAWPVNDGWITVIARYAGNGDFSSDDRVLAYSGDDGATWKVKDVGICVQSQQFQGGTACGAGVCLSVASHGRACITRDRGNTWSEPTSVGGGNVHSIIWDGGRFMAFRGSQAAMSLDGTTWTQVQMRGGENNIDRAARAPSGTYAAVANDGSAFYRSEDGVNWRKVAGPTGREFRHISGGYLRCP